MMSGITIEIIQKRSHCSQNDAQHHKAHAWAQIELWTRGEDIRVSNAYTLRYYIKFARRKPSVHIKVKGVPRDHTVKLSCASYMGSLPNILNYCRLHPHRLSQHRKEKVIKLIRSMKIKMRNRSRQRIPHRSRQRIPQQALPLGSQLKSMFLNNRRKGFIPWVFMSSFNGEPPLSSLQLQAAKEGKLEFEPVGRTEEILVQKTDFSVQLVIDFPLDHSVTEKCIKPIEMAKKLGKFTEDRTAPELLMVGPVDRVVCFQIKVRPLQNNSSTEEYGCCYVMISQLVTAATNAAGIAKCVKQSDGSSEALIVSSSQSSAYMMEKRVRTLSTRHEEDIEEVIEDSDGHNKKTLSSQDRPSTRLQSEIARKQNLC